MPAEAPTAIACPQCGGESPLPSGVRVLSCAFCDAALFVDRGGVVGHYRLPRLLDERQAGEALRRWMAGNDTVKDLDVKSTVESVEAIEFPMWMFRAAEGGGETVYVEPAAPTPIPQLADLRVPAGKLEPFGGQEPFSDASDGEGDARSGWQPATVPVETARGWLRDRGISQVRETALVRVPLWRARYRYAGASYTALIEGSTGQVLAAVFPEKAESPYYLVAAAGLVVFGLLGIVISNPLTKLLAFAVAAVPLVLLAWWVTRRV